MRHRLNGDVGDADIKLEDVVQVGSVENPDFYIMRSGDNAGKPSKVGGTKDLGVKVLRTDIFYPDYLYYMIEFAWVSEFFRSRHSGILIQHIRKADVYDAIVWVLVQGQRPNRRNSDAEIRSSERAVLDDRDDLVEYVKLLRKKLRAGLLSHDRLVMAARLGHEAAREAAPEWVDQGDIDWVGGFSHSSDAISALGDPREIVSFTCDCAERVLGVLEQRHPYDARPRAAIEAARAWVIDPSPNNYTAAAAAGRDAWPDGDNAYTVAFCARAATATAFCFGDAGFAAVSVSYAVADTGDDGADAEYLWQRRRLAKYLLGEITLPPIKNTVNKP